MEVRVFGIVKEIAGGNSVVMDPVSTVAELKSFLSAQYPRLQQLSSFMIAVNGTYASDNTAIHEGDEVAVIPPVSGG